MRRQAFLALHERTADDQWLAHAAAAADYAETWVYAWNVPIPAGPSVYPRARTTLGVSLIALGQSGADNFMAAAVADFRRLGRLTGDEHYTRFASFLELATVQAMDWDGALGYAYAGLMNEAITLAPHCGGGFARRPWAQKENGLKNVLNLGKRNIRFVED